MPKPSPEELLRSIEDAPTSAEEDDEQNEKAGNPDGAGDAFDDAVAEVLAMSPAERRRELEAAGVVVEALHAETAAMLRRAAVPAAAPAPAPARAHDAREPPARVISAGPTAPGPTAPGPAALPQRRRRPPVLLLLAASLAVVGTAIAAAVYFSPAAPPSPPPPPPLQKPTPTPTPGPDVASLRREGIDACKAQRWQDCKERLDLADRYDPAGADAPMVALARAQAAVALAGVDGGDGNVSAKPGPGAVPRPSGSGAR